MCILWVVKQVLRADHHVDNNVMVGNVAHCPVSGQ